MNGLFLLESHCMNIVSKDDYRRLHESGGSPHKDAVLSVRTDRDIVTMNAFERRQELYGLFMSTASPGIVQELQYFRTQYPLGLVTIDENGNISKALTDDFLRQTAALRASSDDLKIADIIYRTMRRSLEAAGDVWRDHMLLQNDADFARMELLMEPEMHQKYGAHPGSKRVASATAQTVGVGLSMQELAIRLYRKKFKVDACPEQLIQAHRSGLRIAMMWADFNRHQLLSLESKIRTLRSDHDGIEPLHAEDAFDIAEDGSLLFVGGNILDSIAAENHDLSEGRFGCPGKRFIPELWDWTEEVSTEHGLIRKMQMAT